MAAHLATIFGTEKDKVNCPFYLKVGACRHGDRCSRSHTRPNASPTLVFENMYRIPAAKGLDDEGLQSHFDDFYEDVFLELSKHGEVHVLEVCENTTEHMAGNVFVMFKKEEDAAAALKALKGRFYFGQPLFPEHSPVTNFREAACRQHEEGTCTRGGECNFMHLKRISQKLDRKLFGPRLTFRATPKRRWEDTGSTMVKRGRYLKTNGRLQETMICDPPAQATCVKLDMPWRHQRRGSTISSPMSEVVDPICSPDIGSNVSFTKSTYDRQHGKDCVATTEDELPPMLPTGQRADGPPGFV